MTIYKIYATKLNGDVELVSPSAVNKDKEEMLKIAKRMKYEMTEFYKKIELRVDIYKYDSSYFIDEF